MICYITLLIYRTYRKKLRCFDLKSFKIYNFFFLFGKPTAVCGEITIIIINQAPQKK